MEAPSRKRKAHDELDSSLRKQQRLDAKDENEDEDEAETMLGCIQSSIAYFRTQRTKDEGLMQTTRITVSSTLPYIALLRRYATIICTSTTYETFDLPVPRPDWVTEGILPGLHDPQWWVGKAAAEVKAGPHADKHDTKKAAAHVKGAKTKNNKKKGPTARKKQIAWKLEKGSRRQMNGERMWGWDSGEGNSGSESKSDTSEDEEDKQEKQEIGDGDERDKIDIGTEKMMTKKMAKPQRKTKTNTQLEPRLEVVGEECQGSTKPGKTRATRVISPFEPRRLGGQNRRIVIIGEDPEDVG